MDNITPQSPHSPVRISPSRSPPQSPCTPKVLNLVKRFSVALTNMVAKPTLADHFYFYFKENAREGYQLDKMDQHVSAQQRKRWRNSFSRLKKSIGIMLRFCRKFPLPPPVSVHEQQLWETELRDLSEIAHKAISKALFPSESKLRLLYTATLADPKFAQQVKHWEESGHQEYRAFPTGMPEAEIGYFSEKPTSTGKRKIADAN